MFDNKKSKWSKSKQGNSDIKSKQEVEDEVMRKARELEESTYQQKSSQDYDNRDKGKFDKSGQGGQGGRGGRQQETKQTYQAKGQPDTRGSDSRGGKGGSKPNNLSKS